MPRSALWYFLFILLYVSESDQWRRAPVLHVVCLTWTAGSKCSWSSRSPSRSVCASLRSAPASSTESAVRRTASTWWAPRRRPSWRSCSGSWVGRRSRRRTEQPTPSCPPPSLATPSCDVTTTWPRTDRQAGRRRGSRPCYYSVARTLSILRKPCCGQTDGHSHRHCLTIRVAYSLAVDSTHTVVGLFRLLVRRSAGNSMPDELRDPACDVDSFKQFFKKSCSALTSVTSALEVIFNVMRSINPRFTYLLTYIWETDQYKVDIPISALKL